MASNILRWALRILVAGIFTVSALAKLLGGIDHFELYIFSFGFFPLNLCFIIARLCIALELVLALFTLCGWYPRLTRLTTIGVLILFSLFLCYSAIIGRNESCQCFGRLVDMNPMQSLVKNAVLLLLVLLYYRMVKPRTAGSVGGRCQTFWRVLPIVLALGVTSVPFWVSVPDNWLYGQEKQPYGEEAFDEFWSTTMQSLSDENGNQLVSEKAVLVSFVTPRCPYCKLARQKITSIVQRHDLDQARILFIEPQMKKNTPGAILISEKQFIEITFAERPRVFLVENGKVLATYHLRNIDEDQIAEAFISR